MKKDFSPHAVSGWMTDQEAETLIKWLLISNGGTDPVVVLVDPLNATDPEGRNLIARVVAGAREDEGLPVPLSPE